MKGKITRQDKIRGLFTAVYFAGYLTRTNFAAIISEIENETGYSKASLSLCLTGLFFAYGLGQLVSGYLGDRARPKALVFIGLSASSLCNFLMAFVRSPALMMILWTVNGFAQSFLWPPIVLMLTALTEGEEYRKAVMSVNSGGSAGAVAVYLISPFLMTLFSWRAVFLCCGILGIAMSGLWLKYCPSVSAKYVNPRKFPLIDAEGKWLIPAEMAGILLAVVIQGALRDGATTWMPTDIEETFHLNGELSILSGAVLPMFSTVSFRIALFIHRKWIRNPVTCASLLFLGGALTTVLLTAFSDVNALLTVVLFTLLSGMMHGINLMLVSLLPSYFTRMGIVSTVSGIVNCCTYIGSAIVTYGIGASVDLVGWETITAVWCFAAAAGCVACFFCSRTGWSRETLG